MFDSITLFRPASIKDYKDSHQFSCKIQVYIDSRYPADFGILPFGQSGEAEAVKAYAYAKDVDTLLRPFVKQRIGSNSTI